MDNVDKNNANSKQAALRTAREITLAYVTAGLTDQKPAQVLRETYLAYMKIVADHS